MKIPLGDSCPLDLEATLCCGQAFRWAKLGEWWLGIINDRPLKMRQTGNELEFENVPSEFVKTYLRLTDDLPGIYSQIGKDACIRRAIERFRGLRILRQDPWECLVSYICATYKSIPAIRQMLTNLSRKFGNRVYLDGFNFYTFPTPEKLAKASDANLGECGLGYRAKYVHQTARMVHENSFGLEHLREVTYEEARKELLNFPGIGLKAADCISLFSLEKPEAFPIDIWIKRAILRHYSRHFPEEFITRISNKKTLTPKEYEKLNLFGRKYFGEYAGYAQEYLYHFERTKKVD